jgi:hypothetical protein
MPANPRPEHKTYTLKARLAAAIRQAKEAPGVPVHIQLKGGLQIYLEYKTPLFYLDIARFKVAPSQVEWTTVLNTWPWKLPNTGLTSIDGDWHHQHTYIPDRQAQPSQALLPELPPS